MPLKTIQLAGTIYGSILTSNSRLILDVRNQEKQTITYYQLNLTSQKLETLSISNSEWWTKLIAADSEWFYLIKYTDRNDPNSHSYLRASTDKKTIEECTDIPTYDVPIISPSIYEVGTGYHKTVADFLSLELPLSCEYLEWGQKIIISYYLRSGSEFDRYLLLLDNGKKEWKLHQDHKMNGFSSGAFFIHNDQLLFFKELNEVCIYTL